MRSRVNVHSLVVWMSSTSFLQTARYLKCKLQERNSNLQPRSPWTKTQPKRSDYWVVLWVLICTIHLPVCYHHLTYVFQRESTLFSCLNVKEPLIRKRLDIWHLPDSNRIWTHNHLVCKPTLNHLAKPTKWSGCVVSPYLHDALDCMLLSCHVGVSDWIYTLQLLELYELSGCRFKSHCCHLNFRYRACFEEEVPWYSGNCSVQIQSETRTWHDNNIQSKVLYR